MSAGKFVMADFHKAQFKSYDEGLHGQSDGLRAKGLDCPCRLTLARFYPCIQECCRYL